MVVKRAILASKCHLAVERASSAVVVDDASTPVTSQDADKHVRAAWRGEGETIEFDHATNPERRG